MYALLCQVMKMCIYIGCTINGLKIKDVVFLKKLKSLLNNGMFTEIFQVNVFFKFLLPC